MKNTLGTSTLILGIILFSSGCSYTTPLHNDYVSTNPRMFQSGSLNEKQVILVIDTYTKDYRLTRPVYNVGFGNLPPDYVSFEIGAAFAKEIANMCVNLFSSVNEVSSFRRAKQKSSERINFIIIPEIINSEILFPSIRFADIKAEIAVKYSFYNSAGNLIDEEIVKGRGEKELGLTRKNSQVAMDYAYRIY